VPLAVDVQAVAPTDPAAWAEQWRAFERLSPASFYLGCDWLGAWTEVYRPRRLRLVRVSAGDATVALGLVASDSRRRWRFAGGPVTAQRGLLCAPGREGEAWAALGAWLRAHPAEWSMLEGNGVDSGAAALPSGKLRPAPGLRLRLPDSFDAYIANRSPTVRKGFRQKLRRLEQAGAEVREVEADRRRQALGAFLELHLARAASKGERHPQMDRRLLELLEAAAAKPSLELRLFELVVAGRRHGVSVRVDYGNTGYFYNSGIDPRAGRLSPGIALELASIRDALARGLGEFDLGPGEYRYKHELGGVVEERYAVLSSSPSPRGRASGAAARVSERARESLRARAGARRLVLRLRRAMPWA
jgi:CelD/BcsL family acetyltransferase involved in cellulose biosynthesis